MPFKPTETCPEPNVYRNPKTGELSPLPGYGSMQEVGEYLLSLDIDWSAPIYEQIYNGDGSLKRDSSTTESEAA